MYKCVRARTTNARRRRRRARARCAGTSRTNNRNVIMRFCLCVVVGVRVRPLVIPLLYVLHPRIARLASIHPSKPKPQQYGVFALLAGCDESARRQLYSYQLYTYVHIACSHVTTTHTRTHARTENLLLRLMGNVFQRSV